MSNKACAEDNTFARTGEKVCATAIWSSSAPAALVSKTKPELPVSATISVAKSRSQKSSTQHQPVTREKLSQ
jgi:hypothetical protein